MNDLQDVGDGDEDQKGGGSKRPSGSDSSNDAKKARQNKGQNTLEAAMSNDLVLDCIFKHLSTPVLIRTCRLVNNQWNRAATKILKKRPDATLRVTRAKDLETMAACIASSADFPFREIDLHISNIDFYDCPEKWLEVELFRRHSAVFTRLKINCIRAPDSILAALLSGPFNHIVSLTLYRVSLDYEKKNYVFCKAGNVLNLEKLETITFGTAACEHVDATFLLALLQSCPNLKRVENCSNAHTAALSTAGKLGTVKSLRVCTCVQRRSHYPAPSGLEMLIIADGRKQMGLGHWHSRMKFSCLLPLLKANRETLRRIEVYTEIVQADCSEDWPQLSNLTSLKLMKPFYFPSNVNDIFPALKTLELGAYPGDDKFFNSVSDFMWDDALASVTTLEVFRPPSSDSEAWEYLSRVVPNVRHIFLGYETRDSVLERSRNPYESDDSDSSNSEKKEEVPKEEVVVPWGGLSCFNHLETLYISPLELPGTNLDQMLTELPDIHVKELRANPQLSFPPPIIPKGIARVRGLKELVMGFTASSQTDQEENSTTSCPVSLVALKYGLNRASTDLKIRFLYDQWGDNAHLIEEALRPVSTGAGVTFGHWNPSHGYLETPQRSTGLAICQRTEHPRLSPWQPWIDMCTRGLRQTARKSTGGIPQHLLQN